MSKLTKAESAHLNRARSLGPKPKALILQNDSQAEFLEMLNACFDLLQPADTTVPAGACAVTLKYRKAEDKIRRRRGSNILDEIPVLQNEPTDLDLSALDSMSDANRDFHRTQRTHGLTADYLRKILGGYAAKRTVLAELRLAPHLTEKLQNDPTEPAKQALNGRSQPLNGALKRKKAEKTAWLLMIYSGSSI